VLVKAQTPKLVAVVPATGKQKKFLAEINFG
jgi:hypothetical protein